MAYAILCDARKGSSLGVEKIALVDRKKTKSQWWTSDQSQLILNYRKRSAADFACKRLKRNNPEVISYERAVKVVENQAKEILLTQAERESEEGWER